MATYLRIVRKVDGELKYGLTEVNMKESGSTIKQMEKVSFGLQMATPMKATGKTTRRRVMVITNISMVRNI